MNSPRASISAWSSAVMLALNSLASPVAGRGLLLVLLRARMGAAWRASWGAVPGSGCLRWNPVLARPFVPGLSSVLRCNGPPRFMPFRPF